MLGMRRSVLALAQHSTCAVLMSLISLHWVQVSFRCVRELAGRM
jgi:hypothetical protein